MIDCTARGPGAVLLACNLSGAGLADTNLELALLHGATLTSAHLRGAALSGATLSGANLTGAALSGATLSGAWFLNTICPSGVNSMTTAGTALARARVNRPRTLDRKRPSR
jgi:uncharacterized protein YjbI with pentapeptide repeats